MILPSLLAASALALQAAAQLVPLELHPSHNAKEIASTLGQIPQSQKSRTIYLDCPGCAFDTVNDHQGDHPGTRNSLKLEFSVDDADNSLKLNGKTIYPVQFPFTADLYAPLARSDDSAQSPPLRLSYMIEFAEERHLDGAASVLPINFGILNMEGLPVNVDKVAINVIKTPGQSMVISSAERVPFDDKPTSQCHGPVCRARESIFASLRKMIEDARARAGKVGGRLGMKGCGRKHSPPGSKHAPGHHRVSHHGMRGRHGHFRHSRIHRFVHRATHMFIIPALLGIIGGLAASAIGMVVGQTIVFLWFRFARGGQRGQASRIRLSESGLEEEKEALVEEEALPEYTDAEIVLEDKQ